MNVNISNELNFSDVYRSVNYIGSLAKFIYFARDSMWLHFDKPQKNEIHPLNFLITFICHLNRMMAGTHLLSGLRNMNSWK